MLVFAMTPGWDDRLTALLEDQIMQAVGVVGPVCQNLARLQATDQIAGGSHVVLLAGAEMKAHRQAKRIDYGMDLGAEPASGTAESLGLRSPLFRRPPAACA